MNRWSSRQVLALALAVLLGLGMSLSAAQASDMATKITASGSMNAPGSSSCDGCGGDDGDAKAGMCLPICTGSSFAVIPSGLFLKIIDRSKARTVDLTVSQGQSSRPDPYPPRPFIIG